MTLTATLPHLGKINCSIDFTMKNEAVQLPGTQGSERGFVTSTKEFRFRSNVLQDCVETTEPSLVAEDTPINYWSRITVSLSFFYLASLRKKISRDVSEQRYTLADYPSNENWKGSCKQRKILSLKFKQVYGSGPSSAKGFLRFNEQQ